MFTIPNILTMLRLCAVPVFLVASLRGNFTLAFCLFVGAALTDILDGMIARRLNQRSRLGAVLDPAADKTMMVCGFLFYTFRAMPVVQIPGWLTFTVFIRDFLIMIFAYLLYTRTDIRRFPPTWQGKASTVLQAVTLSSTIATNAFAPGLLPLSEVLFRLSLAMTLYSGWGYLRRGDRLIKHGAEA
jgi:cardiolipin synthase